MSWQSYSSDKTNNRRLLIFKSKSFLCGRREWCSGRRFLRSAYASNAVHSQDTQGLRRRTYGNVRSGAPLDTCFGHCLCHHNSTHSALLVPSIWCESSGRKASCWAKQFKLSTAMAKNPALHWWPRSGQKWQEVPMNESDCPGIIIDQLFNK